MSVDGFDIRNNAERERDQAIEELTEALRFTVEYVGTEMLPPVEGWSWYDALLKYAPDKAQVFLDFHNKHDLWPKENRS